MTQHKVPHKGKRHRALFQAGRLEGKVKNRGTKKILKLKKSV